MNKVREIMSNRNLILSTSIIVMLMINFFIIIPKTYSNPMAIPADYFLGGIIPNDNITLNLLDASVVFNIDSTDFLNTIGINFDGNYSIFNPDNLINVTLYAPFRLDSDLINSSCDVQVNGTPISFELIKIYKLEYNVSEMIMDYLSNPFLSLSNLIVCNLTLAENSTTTIRYRFNGTVQNPLYAADEFSITYDLGTAKAWQGNITEKVEFVVNGKIPNSYREFSNYSLEDRCQITNINNGRVYTWEWDDEYINTQLVGIIYRGRLLQIWAWWEVLLIGGSIVGINVLVVFLILHRRKRKKSHSIKNYP
jgi:hypothetical protein